MVSIPATAQRIDLIARPLVESGIMSIIGCPQCKDSLVAWPRSLHCSRCRVDYPVTDGIPSLISPFVRAAMQEGQAPVKDFYLTERYDHTKDPKGLEFMYHRYRRWETSMQVLKLLRPWDVVLDIGCGTGLITRKVAPLSHMVIAMDLNPWSLARLNGTPRTAVIQGDGEAIAAQDDSVDLVIATEMVEHLETPDKIAREIFRVVKKGGHVVGSVPSTSPIWKLRDRLSMTCPGNEPVHFAFTKTRITQVWKAAGFKVKVRSSCFGMNWLWVIEKP